MPFGRVNSGMSVNSDDLPDVPTLQNEVMSLISGWADRGVSPKESAMVLAGMSHALLAKLGFTLGELIPKLVDGWRGHNGKL